ncbi:MAG: HAMP domain-containing histidine kinase [Acidobacteria bacterium]|nr:HAMP domain-containing histidine kinase [Acidobacteriota bacterium]
MIQTADNAGGRFWWLLAMVLVLLCVALGVIQYRWLGELSEAEQQRMQTGLGLSLQRLSRDFNTEINAAAGAIMPRAGAEPEADRQAEYQARIERWRANGPAAEHLFKAIAIAQPNDDRSALNLFLYDLEARMFRPAEWPTAWAPLRERTLARLTGPGFGPPPPGEQPDAPLIELPRFHAIEPGQRRESEWLLLELNLDHVRTAMLPELVQRHLGNGGKLDYQVAVSWRNNPSNFVFQTEPGFTGDGADATIPFFEPSWELAMRRGGFRRAGGIGGGGGGPRTMGKGPPPPGFGGPGGPGGFSGGPGERGGYWNLAVRHRAGSLEHVVQHARWRNLGILASLLALMLAALAVLIRFTQRERRLAWLQMDFVAGISHELRTPLAVIRTAGHNLQGGLVTNPKQIQRYGALVRDESERLTGIVEQVLRFAGAQAGRVIQKREPASVETIIDEALAATACVTEGAGCIVERDLEPNLPRILADSAALRQAIINLIGNAAKYGFSGAWIGVKASATADGFVEIKVADHGPGIPAADLRHIFDAFYRGKSAVADQIHGTGLGLNLVKRIAEAHDGKASVHSEPGQGTEFTLRIPIAQIETKEHEFEDSVS